MNIAALKSWLKRQRDKGQEPNADEIWKRIVTRWPNLTETEQEKIFQSLP